MRASLGTCCSLHPLSSLQLRTFSCEYYNLKDIVVGYFSVSALKIDGLDLFFQSSFLLRAKTQTTLVTWQCNLWKSKFTILYFTLYLWHKEETAINTYSINPLLSFRKQQEAINKSPLVAAKYWEDKFFIFLKINSFILRNLFLNLILIFFSVLPSMPYMFYYKESIFQVDRDTVAPHTDVPLT